MRNFSKQGHVIKAGLLDYEEVWELQRRLFEERRQGSVPDTLLLTEHPPTYTFGKTGHEKNLLVKQTILRRQGVGVFHIDRGGDVTFHGPGQLVGYPILDLRDYYRDVGRYLRDLEEVLIQTLAVFDVHAGRVEGLTGVWVEDAKVAAIGVKVTRWFTMHGFALNVNTDLTYFEKIIPCGIPDKRVTSLAVLLGKTFSIEDVQEVVMREFMHVFDIALKESSQLPLPLPSGVGLSENTTFNLNC